MNHLCVLLVAMVQSLSALPAQTSKPTTTSAPASRPAVPDLCRGVVDPYDAARQRMLFLNAAGVDNELDPKEFRADQARPNGFARKFDSWAEMLRFDKNSNGTIDWLEAEAYREDLRKRVLAAFDTNHNDRLEGPEREAANLALAAGGLLNAEAVRSAFAAARGGGAPGEAPASEEQQRRLALHQQWQQRMLAKYDRDGDGVLNEEERAAMQADLRRQHNPMQTATEDWAVRQFDADGDGKLDEHEQAARDEFLGGMRDLGKVWELHMADLDGDGVISEEERQQARAAWQKQGFRLMASAMRYMDADADGKISPDEREAFNEKLRAGIAKWLETTTAKYAGADGKLDENGRAEMLKGIRTELEERIRTHSDDSGRLSPEGAVKLIEDWATELGIEPVRSEQPASAPATPQE